MTYSEKTTRRIKWEHARFMAYKVLLDHKITDFPLDIVSIIKLYPDIKLLTYSEQATLLGITLQEIVVTNASPDGCLSYHAGKNKYLLAYNDNIENRERIYWTLAHEFGHYILEHHKEMDKSNLSRMRLTDEEYDLYEKEADFFVRFLINPPSIIREWKEISYYRVMDFFKVSFSAANSTLGYLKRISNDGWSVVAPYKLKKQLEPFIRKVNKGKTCTHCNSFFVLDESDFCPICGTKGPTKLFLGDDCNVKYPGHETNETGKVLTCPRCSNEDIYKDGDHCSQCGVYVVNKWEIEKEEIESFEDMPF